MNPPTASRNDAVLVWDAPLRVFHWLLALCFVGAFLTGDSDRWRDVHVTLGYTVAALVCFRIAWGLFGTRHARFTDFVRGPAATWRYVRSLLADRPEQHAGHNPAGAIAILALLALAAGVALSGWATEAAVGGEWLEDLHEGLVNAMLTVVLLHVAGVAFGSLLQRENLVRAMFTGRKRAPAGEAISSSRRILAALLLAAVAGFWWSQWDAAPGAARTATHEEGQDED
jgi:cytochrome b